MTPPKQVWPTIRYDDAPAAIRFLVDVCGFEESLVVKGDGERVIEHAQLRWPEGGGVMLGTTATTGDHAAFNTERVGVYVVTDDPDGVCERVKAAGAEIIRDLQDEDFGGRGFSVRDAEANAWTFGSYRGE
jgi:uncharacterized glyoxalase superfamily protein PhnB